MGGVQVTPFHLNDEDYQVLLTVLIDASNPLPNDSKRKEVLDELRYKLMRYRRLRKEFES